MCFSAGLQDCLLKPLPRQSHYVAIDRANFEAERASIRSRVDALDLDGYYARRPVVYNVSQVSSSLPVRSCNDTAVNIWRDWVQSNPLESLMNERDLEIADSHQRSNWTAHAKRAIRATIDAFNLVRIPVIMTDGTALGWYRQCGVIEHTDDMDISFPVDHIVSMEHFNLLHVCCNLQFTFSSCFYFRSQ